MSETCLDCDGRGFEIVWVGHGGNEREAPGPVCEACLGEGELNYED